MRFFQVNEQCNGCLSCVLNCPATALDFKDMGEQRTLFHNMARCARCATCWRVCPQDAIEFQHLLENEWAEVTTLALMRCEVCGEPVHTARLKETLDEKLHEVAVPLCPQHRARHQGMVRAHLKAGSQ